ncbi:hypothetical protein HOY82DRAFT_597908 [Tuber indicum]|nr:hypothetical protein HOY82DRAFT_597908 [Tuber indicum]
MKPKAQNTLQDISHLPVLSARLVYIPSYTMCNIKGHGAVIVSDLFYWLVQFMFEMLNGWVGSNVMMSTPG